MALDSKEAEVANICKFNQKINQKKEEKKQHSKMISLLVDTSNFGM